MESPLTLMLRLAALLLMLPLTDCSALLESFRPTYDERYVVPGADRATIEGQLGKPIAVVALSDGAAQVIYRTSRVSHGVRRSIASSRALLAGYTLGLSEVLHPAYVHEHQARRFKIDFDAHGNAVHIESACEAGNLQRWDPYSPRGWHACADAFMNL